MSLLIGCISGLLMINVSNGNIHSILIGITVFNIFSFLVTAIPLKYPRWWGAYKGLPSDGLQFLNLLRGNK
ncbi:hypothetical protein K8O68_10390 [Salipaludibacillus sp. CUR1]|uniref:hypothetical protein n=1 Tax=Salipaludibacillus sp. CUR1 TaxID=2820003 RepID=UPI001E595E5C|nr:hypothetical protein [Salipaludibacillus sp. CUR1]MCE7792823.1 hypothetical protein [Salipaludibacillus sp. CUR1]